METYSREDRVKESGSTNDPSVENPPVDIPSGNSSGVGTLVTNTSLGTDRRDSRGLIPNDTASSGPAGRVDRHDKPVDKS